MALSTYVKEFFGRAQLVFKNSSAEQVDALAETDGTVRQQLIFKDPDSGTQVAAAADDSGGDKGALHVKLKGAFLATQQDIFTDQIVGWLKVIAFHLAELRKDSQNTDTHIFSPDNLPDEYNTP